MFLYRTCILKAAGQVYPEGCDFIMEYTITWQGDFTS